MTCLNQYFRWLAIKYRAEHFSLVLLKSHNISINVHKKRVSDGIFLIHIVVLISALKNNFVSIHQLNFLSDTLSKIQLHSKNNRSKHGTFCEMIKVNKLSFKLSVSIIKVEALLTISSRSQMFFKIEYCECCEYCEISRNSFFYRTPPVPASD